MDISITGIGHSTSDTRYTTLPAPNIDRALQNPVAHAVAAPAERDTVTLSPQAIARLEMQIDASQERLDQPVDAVPPTTAARAGLVMELQSLNNALAKALKDQTQTAG